MELIINRIIIKIIIQRILLLLLTGMEDLSCHHLLDTLHQKVQEKRLVVAE